MLSLRGVRLGSTRLMQLLIGIGVRLGSRTTYAALKGVPSKSRIDSRTQTGGPSPYWYRLNTTSRQADTTSTGTWKATDTTSRRTSNESVRVTSQILLVSVLVMSHQTMVYES
jgi:hypothetical protein